MFVAFWIGAVLHIDVLKARVQQTDDGKQLVDLLESTIAGCMSKQQNPMIF